MTNRRQVLKGAGAVIGGIAVSPLMFSRGIAATPVKIGVLAPITGPLAPYGDALKKGMDAGIELINAAGGFGGREVSFVLADDQTDPKAAATQSRRLLIDERVDLLMGTTSSATTLAVIPQAEAAKKPFFYVVEGEDKTCTKDGATRKLICGNGETPEQKMEKFVPYMIEHIGKRIFFIGSDYVFPHFVIDITRGLVEQNGGSTAGVLYAPLGTSEFSSQISTIAKSEADVVFIAVVGTDGVALVKQIGEFGLRDKVQLTGIPTFAAEVLPGIAPVTQGVFTVDRYWEGLDNPVNKQFTDLYRKKFGIDAPVSTIAAQGAYGTMLLMKAAVEKADSVEAEKIADVIPGISFDSPAGRLTVNPENNIVTGPIRLLQIEGNGYRLVQDFGDVAHKGHSGCSSNNF